MVSLKDVIEPSNEHGKEYRDRVMIQGYRVISPSGLKKWFTNRSEWRLNVLDNIKTFNGNTNTVLGSIVHKYCELYRKNGLTKEGKIPSIEVDRILSTTTNLDIQSIYRDYPTMCEAIREEYLELYPNEYVLDTELYLEYDFKELKVLIAGTMDELYSEGNDIIIVDFKTSKSPYKDEYDLVEHLYQLSVYNALLFKCRGITANKFRIVNIAKPTKTVTNRVNVLECDSVDISSNVINDMLDVIHLVDNKPELKDIIFPINPLEGYVVTNKDNLDILVKKYIKNFSITNSEVKKRKQIIKNVFS